MGMTEGRASLRKSVKELMFHWSEAKAHWNDATSHGFENKFLVPLDLDAKHALSAMDTMAQILSRIKQDCEDS
jgi:hypothetical protein